MQPFLERIVGHLERVQRISEREVVDPGIALDFGHHTAFVADLFAKRDAGELRRCWESWYLRRFVEEVHWDLLDGAGRRWTAMERRRLIDEALTHRWGRTRQSTHGSPRAALVQTLVEDAERRIGAGPIGPSGWIRWQSQDWQSAPRYCERLGLTRVTMEGPTVAPSGATMLGLRGSDRLRWLLALETCVATSSLDPWCMDLASVRSLSKQREWWLDPRDEEPPPANDEAIARWTALGALRDAMREELQSSQATIFDVTDVGAIIFDELAADDATSFRILARALLEDEREHLLAPIVGHDRSQDRAATATLRHARMVAHEVRNALLPVQYALREVWADPALSSASLAPQRRTIEDGLARLHRFVDDSLRLTPIAAEVAEPFSVMEAVEEARRQLDPAPGGGVLIEARPGSADPRCRGHRGRFVLALLNVLRNAVQVGGPDVRVEIGIDARTPGRVTVSIRDDGPGLSEAQQASVFENGVSYRDGGSGHGLSFVRVVVQEEMGGTVRLISPPGGGGACFQLELPTHEETR